MSEALLFIIQQKDSLLNEQLKEINRLREIIRKKDEALEFFADYKNYEYYETFENEEHPDDRYFTTKVLEFGLEKAQQALSLKESDNGNARRW